MYIKKKIFNTYFKLSLYIFIYIHINIINFYYFFVNLFIDLNYIQYNTYFILYLKYEITYQIYMYLYL